MSISQPTSEDNSKIRTTIIAFIALYIIWGTTYLAISIAVHTIPPFLMAGVRFLIAGSATYAFLRLRGVPRPTKPQWRSAAIIGAFLLVGGNGLVTWAEQEVPSSIAALIVATMPMWMVMFDWLIFKGPRPARKIVAGLLLGLVGIILLIGPGQILGTATFSSTHLLIMLAAPVLWSLGSLYARHAPLPKHVFMSTAMEMLAGGLLLLIAAGITGEFGKLDIPHISTQSLAAMLYLTIFGSIVAFTAYVWLLQNVTPARVSTYTYVNPVIAVFLGWLILSEPITALTLVAVVVIIAAVVLITSQKPKAVTQPEPAPTD